MATKKTAIDDLTGGLLLMIIFTTGWTILATYFFGGIDYHLAAIVFGIAIIYMIYSYLQLQKAATRLPAITIEPNSKKEKWFYIVFILEGVAILLLQNILANIGRHELFICSIALVVGLHFIPLANIFNRRLDYYISSWTILVAVVGLLFISKNNYEYTSVNAFVCAGCAISTSLYGFQKIGQAKVYVKQQAI